MGDLLRFPRTRQVDSSIAIEGLLYADELIDLAEALKALEKRDRKSKSDFGPPIGTIVPFSSLAGTHIGNLVKVDEGVWGLDVCMADDCEGPDECS